MDSFETIAVPPVATEQALEGSHWQDSLTVEVAVAAAVMAAVEEEDVASKAMPRIEQSLFF
jgi:hypothetical protein